jgi:predicted anti-sigma-YlaC factor YlaD
MNKPDCLALRQAVFQAGEMSQSLRQHPDLAAHLAACAECRLWLDAFEEGLGEGDRVAALGAGIMARTAPGACMRARDLAGASFDGPLPAVDATLLTGHLETCGECRAVTAEMAATSRVLPALADIDPGPWFTARVLAATSRRRASARLADRWRRAWSAMVDRPRFALEAAYALTLVLFLVAGNPMTALGRTAARIEPVARQRLADGVEQANRAITSGLDALKERAAAQTVVPAADWGLAARARGLWQQVAGALAGGLSDLIDAIASAADRVWQWARELFGAPARTGEPPTDPVRSPR